MQPTHKFARPGWLSIAAILIILVGAFWILKPVGAGAESPQDFASSASAIAPGAGHIETEGPPSSFVNPISSSSDVQRTETGIAHASALFKLLVLDTEGHPVSDLQIAHRPIRQDIWCYSLERLPADELLGTTNEAGFLALPEFTAPAVSLVAQNSNWLVVDGSTLPAPYEGVAKLVVRNGGSITGVVVAADGPVEGAVVQVAVNSDFLTIEEPIDSGPKPMVFALENYRFARTDHTGRFQIKGLLPDSRTLHILADNYAPLRHEFVGPSLGETVDIGSLTLEPGIDVTFHVTSPAVLEEGTRLFLEMKGKESSRGAEGLLLGAQGKVLVADMHPGKYKWDLERPGAVCATGEIHIEENTQDVRIQVAATRTLEVKVRTEDGLPIEDVTLKVYEKDGRRFHVKMDGSFSLSCSEEKSANIKAKASGFVDSPRIRVPAAEDSIEIVLQRLGRLQIQLIGMDARPSLRLGVKSEAMRNETSPFGGTPPGVRFRDYSIENQQVVVADVEPGTIEVMLDLGAGPTPFGPFVVKAAEITVIQIEVQLPREITAVVRDSKTHAPIAGAEIRHTTSRGNDFARTLGKMIGVNKPADAISNAEGKFTALAFPKGPSYFSVVAPHYEAKTARFNASASQPYQVELTAFPSAPLRVLFSQGQAAHNAVVNFLSIAGGLPSSIGSVSIDENGEGIIDTVPSGACFPTVDYHQSNSVRYRVGFSSQRIRDNQLVEFTLVENPGWLTFEELPQGKVQRVSVRSAHATMNLGTLIRCDSDWWQPSRAPLPITPGTYRVTAISAGKEYLASCMVRSGETTHVIWDSQGEGQISVELLGGDWTTCQLALSFESGDFAGEKRHLSFDRTPQGMVIENLPEGKYLVRLVAWTDLRGNRHKPSWSQRATVNDQAGTVHFRLDAAAMASIFVVDGNGTPLDRARVACAAVNDSETTLVDGITNKNGRIQLLLPLGEVVFRISRSDRKHTETRLHHGGEGEFTLVCPSRD